MNEVNNLLPEDSMTRYKRTNWRDLPEFSKSDPTDDEIKLWLARDAYGSICGMLVTEEGDLDAPIAFIVADEGKDIESLVMVSRAFSDTPNRLDNAFEPDDRFPRIDLRDRGRANSKRPMPGWCYSLRLNPHYGMYMGSEPIDWNPFCPIRLAMMLAKKPA